MRVAVEEPVAEDHRHPRLGDQVREPAALVDRPRVELEIADLDAVEILERQHTRARVAPVDARHRDVRMPGEVEVERLRVAALEAVVELLPDRLREFVDELARVDEVEHAHALDDEPRRLLEQLDVALDRGRRVRPLHLDGDAAPVREHRAVHLADRRRRQHLLVELEEEPLDRLAELLADHALDIHERKRPHLILQAAQLGDDVRRHDVGPRREQLPELDERRPELVEHLAQMAAARGRRAVDGRVPAPAFEQIAEAVAHRDLRDLAQPADVQRPRPGGHPRKCCS